MAFPNFFGGNKSPQSNAGQPPVGQTASSDNSLDAVAGNIQQHAKLQQDASTGAGNSNPPAPLESYKSLWETDNAKQATKPKGVLPDITAEQLSQTLANSNFLSTVSQELLQKAATGDTQAFTEVINQGLRTVMTQSVLASRGLVEAGTRNHGEQLREMLPSMVRSNNVANYNNNPLYNNPAVKPMFESVKQQFEQKHPTASAKEIAEMTDAYFKDFVAAIGGTQQSSNSPAKGTEQTGETDWFAVLGIDKQ